MGWFASFAKHGLAPGQTCGDDDAMAAVLYMDAVIRPNRSLSRRGFYWLLGALIAFNLAIGSLMVALGAFPVPIFLGLDVLGVFLAFRASYRRGGQFERVCVSAEEVVVIHQAGRIARTVWTSPTAFTGVSLDQGDDQSARLRLKLSGKGLTVAAALSPRERTAFADALERAIRKARTERYA
jgi:uncharacterized membrane protein